MSADALHAADLAAARRVLAGSWQLMGHETQLEGAGAYLAEDVAGAPLVAVRDEGGAIRVFRNACRHRLGPVAPDGAGRCAKGELVCAYHGWAYALDGRLKRATDFGPAPGFDARALGLAPVAHRLWRGFLFVALDEARAGDFDAFVRPLDARMARFDLSRVRVAARRAHEIACRWTVYVENYLEGYHVPRVHPGLDAEIVASDYRVTVEGDVAIHEVPTKGGAVYDGLWAWAWPNLGVNVYADGLMMERMVPVGPARTRLDYLYLFDDPAADRSATFAMSDAVTAEDKSICEAVERNMAAGGVGLGPLSPRHEGGVAAFRARLAAALAA